MKSFITATASILLNIEAVNFKWHFPISRNIDNDKSVMSALTTFNKLYINWTFSCQKLATTIRITLQLKELAIMNC